MKKVKTFLKKNKKRAIILFPLFCLTACLFWHDYKTAEAVALPLDMLGGIILEMSMYTAGLAAGEDKEDIVESNPYKGTENPTVNNARNNYVKECFPENTFKLKLGFDDVNYNTFIESIGILWANGSYIISKDFCNKVWNNLPTDGSSALKPKDVVTDENNATILQFPNLNPDNDNEDEDSESGDDDISDNKLLHIFDPTELSVSSSVLSGVFATKFFNAVYHTLVNLNGKNMEDSLNGTSEKACDYSASWWKDNPTIFDTGYLLGDYMNGHSLSFNTEFLPTIGYIYPLAYQSGDSVFFGFACTKDISGTSFSLCGNSYNPFGACSDSASFPFSSMDIDVWFSRYCPVNENTSDLYKAQNVLDGKNRYFHGENIINVKTLENFKKFCEYVSSGDYTLDELLDIMEKGWKVKIAKGEKEWDGVKNKGKTANDTLNDPDKGKKYKTETGKVNLDSLNKGIEMQSDVKHGQPLYEFLGDPTEGTEVESQPGNDSSPDTGAQPGTGTSPNTGSSPDVVGVNYPDVGVAWWGGEYAPSNDPDSTPENDPEKVPDLDPDPVPSSNPDDPDKTSSPSESEQDGKKPFIPGMPSDDDTDNGSVQWYQRFPFCIPWDIYRFIDFFSAEKKKPCWEIPFTVKRLGVSEKIKIDFSSGDYDDIISLIHVFICLSYGAGLVLVTRKIIKG